MNLARAFKLDTYPTISYALPSSFTLNTSTPLPTLLNGVSQPGRIINRKSGINVTTTEIFSYTGSDQFFTVPFDITEILVYLWGAGGGSGGDTGGYGGAGAMVQGVLSVTPGDALTIIVGQGGYSAGALTTYGGGGAGSDPGGGTSGAGGGRSAIHLAHNDLVTAGAGGGGGYSVTQGGKATYSGIADNGSEFPNGGGGGSESSGGAAGTGSIFGSPATPGTLYQGGNGSGFGGGGGGGYYGGGGASSDIGAAGGGGSSYTLYLSLIPGEGTLGYNSIDNYSAPNSSSPYWVPGVGDGGPKETSGGNGLIVIRY